MKKKRNEGFTLIELLIVMAIITSLVGAIVPVGINSIKQAKALTVARNLQTLSTVVQEYVYTTKTSPIIFKNKSLLNTVVLNKMVTGVSTSVLSKYYIKGTAFTDGVATITVWYKDTNISYLDIQSVNFNATPIIYGHKNYPGTYVNVAKYW